MLRGGGLSSVLGYDDGVYYGGAVAFAHGRLPYRDFLLLHPPGVLLGLAPLAALGRLTNEVTGWELSRLAWMLLGCVSALLIMRSLRPVGLVAAVTGGGFYAIFPGAVLVERTTLLEGLANVLLASALALLTPRLIDRSRDSTGSTRAGPAWVWAAAGGLLGLATTVKIWGEVPVIEVVCYVAIAVGLRPAALVAAGSAVGFGAVWLPFFVTAPTAMWRMVVANQLGRPRQDGRPVERLAEIFTMDHLSTGWPSVAVAVIGVAALVVVSLLAWTQRPVRIGVALLLSTLLVLLASPTFFPHYLGALAVPAALVVGAGTQRLAHGHPGRRSLSVPLVLVGCAALAVDLAGMARIRSGDMVPAARLATVVQPATGCITADDATTLLALGVLGRNVDRHCEVVVDLGGYSHDYARGTEINRTGNVAWQRFCLRYLASGDLAIVTRFASGRSFEASTRTEVQSWPTRARSGDYVVRAPG